MYIDIFELKGAAQGYWLDILTGLARQYLHLALENPGQHVPCPIHGGRDGFRLFKDVEDTGGGICNTCGAFADGFSLLRWLTGWSFPETVNAVADYLGMLPAGPVRHSDAWSTARQSDPDLSKRRLEAQHQVWSGSLQADNSAAFPLRRYLSNRGILLEHVPNVLRLHPRLAYYDDKRLLGHFPAMVALVVDGDDRPVTIHRTYLTGGGQKATVPSPKKLMACRIDGQSRGCAIRLFRPTEVLGVAEGIETALSVHLGTGEPVWATVSAGGLQNVVIPPHIRSVRVWADNDQSGRGQDAAAKLARRLLAEGREVKILLPPTVDTDWNDTLRKKVI